MSQTVGDIAVRVGADISGLVSGMDKADGALGRFGASAKSMSAIYALASSAVVAGGIAIVKNQINVADAALDAAEAAGTSVEQFTRLSYAMKFAGEGGADMSKNLLFLNKAIASNSESFKALGISVKDSAGNARSASEVIYEIADAFQAMPDGAKKAAIAVDLFGRSGDAMIPLLNQGADGLRKLGNEADALGATISTKTAKQAAEFNDNLARLGTVAQGASNSIASAVLPTLNKFTVAAISLFGGVTDANGGLLTFNSTLSSTDSKAKTAGESITFLAAATKRLKDETAAKQEQFGGLNYEELTKRAKAYESQIKITQRNLADAQSRFEAGGGSAEVVKMWETAVDEKRAQLASLNELISKSKEKKQEEKVAIKTQSEADRKKEEAARLREIEAEKLADKQAAMKADAEQQLAYYQQGIAALEANNMTELEVMAKQLEEKRVLIANANALGIGDKAANDALLQQYEQQHSEKVTAIQQELADKQKAIDEAARAAKIKGFADLFSTASTMMNSGSRKMFEIGKAAALANGALNAYESIMTSYAFGSRIGGPIVGAAFASLAGIAQFGMLNNIRKQSFNGGGGGGSSSAGGGSVTGAINAANTPVQNQPTQRTNVTLIGDTFGRAQIIGLLNEAFKDGYTLSPT